MKWIRLSSNVAVSVLVSAFISIFVVLVNKFVEASFIIRTMHRPKGVETIIKIHTSCTWFEFIYSNYHVLLLQFLRSFNKFRCHKIGWNPNATASLIHDYKCQWRLCSNAWSCHKEEETFKFTTKVIFFFI